MSNGKIKRTTLVSIFCAAALCSMQQPASSSEKSPPGRTDAMRQAVVKDAAAALGVPDKSDQKTSSRAAQENVDNQSGTRVESTAASTTEADGKAETRAERSAQKSSEGESDLAVNVPVKQAQTRGFGLRLLEQVLQEKKNENVLISPYSAHVVLSMTMSGAKGKTREEMAKMLDLSGVSPQQANANAQSMIDSVTKEHGAPVLEVANAVFIDKALELVPGFTDKCKQFYSADVQNLPFADPATVTAINKWCADKTHNKISKIIDSLTKDDIMVLLNAIYFKGNWEQKFEKGDTTPQPFYLLNGSQKKVPMMSRSDHMQYLRGKGFSAVSLPYEGGKTAMIVMLPDKGKSPSQLVPILAASQFPQNFEKQTVLLEMPRFKIECTTKLRDALKRLGMVQACSSSTADFTGMVSAKTKAYISQVLQKTYMDVNEEGTEAAAVTAVTMSRGFTSAAPVKPIAFTVDRPFIVALVHKPTNELLFIGLINEPK